MNKLRQALANTIITINAIIIDVTTEGMLYIYIYIFDNVGNLSKEKPFGIASSQ